MIEEFKCPNCGGSVEFDWSTQNLKCPYCDAEFDIEGLKAAKEADSKDHSDSASFKKSGVVWEEDGSRHYVCHSCGGEIIASDTEASLSCPWCGNPVVMTDQLSDELKPDLVIPFKLGKEEAKAAFREHLKGKKLMPRIFRDKATIDEIKGVYVPVWVFDAKVKAYMDIPATNTSTWSDSKYIYTKTSHYRLLRDAHLEIQNLPVDGSSKMPDSIMEPLGPWDMSEAVDFQTAYLSGFLADRYDVDADESSKRVAERAKTTAEKLIRSTIFNYFTGPATQNSITAENGEERYVLLPVWILRSKWEGKDWYYAMNGQNGKFVGDLPMDKSLKNKYFALSFLAFGAIGALLASLIQLF